jgi:bud emergence protein 1
MDNGALPHVEDWKKQILNYKANAIVLDVLNDSAPIPSASHPFTSANISPPTAHPPTNAQMASTQPYDEQQLSDRPQTPTLPDGLLLSANVVSFHIEMDEYWFRVHALYQPFGLSRAGLPLPPAKQLVLFRTHNDFIDYQIALLETFPREAGRESGHRRIIPFLPGLADEVYRALGLASTRRRELDDYLRRLHSLKRTTARYILEHKLTREFLALKPGDLEGDKKPQYKRMTDAGWYEPSEEPVPVSIDDP